MASQKKFQVKARRVVFSKGPIHLVDCRVRMPSGRTLSRQIIEHPGSIVIVPEAAPGRFILIRQFRFAVRSWLWEFPAGGMEKGETARQAARRELMEEIQYCPRKLRKIISIYPTPGISAEKMHLYLASDLFEASLPGDEDEEIEVKKVTSGQLESMIRTGRIQDAKTILGFLYLKRYRSSLKKRRKAVS